MVQGPSDNDAVGPDHLLRDNGSSDVGAVEPSNDHATLARDLGEAPYLAYLHECFLSRTFQFQLHHAALLVHEFR